MPRLCDNERDIAFAANLDALLHDSEKKKYNHYHIKYTLIYHTTTQILK
jgi:hypothetical protein